MLSRRPAGRAKGTAIPCLDLNKWSEPGVQEMEVGMFHERDKAETRPRTREVAATTENTLSLAGSRLLARGSEQDFSFQEGGGGGG